MKKLISALLCVFMLISLMPASFAAEGETADEIVIEDEISDEIPVEVSAEDEPAAEPEEETEAPAEVDEEIIIEGTVEAEELLSTVASGTCGDNLTWLLENGVLTISGEGAMENYSLREHAPWYSSKTDISSVVVEQGVTRIGSAAFYNCSSLTSIVIPNGVTSIGNYAFEYCSSLTSVTIPDSVTRIGDYAFEYCSSLTSVTIPDSVTRIGDYAFGDCSSLTSIVIPNGVTSIGVDAFANCSSLTSVTIPEGVTSIGVDAFANCSSLTSVTIPEGVTSIGVNAFANCSSLTNMTIPDSVTSIGGGAFLDCSSLTSVTIPSSVTSIGSYAFEGCSSLTSVVIPDGLTSIGNYVFVDCSSLTSVVIPDSVTSIGVAAFRSCSSLTSVTIPASVEAIGNNAFVGCPLTEVVYTGTADDWNNIELGDGNELLVYLVNGISIADGVNGNCGTKHVWNIKDGVLTICGRGDMPDFTEDESAPWTGFSGCFNQVVIDNGVASIGSYAFAYCSSQTSVTIPDSVTSIGVAAFRSCSSLTSVTIPNSVTSIGDGAFSGSSLTSVTIPDSVTSIGTGVFSGCSSLTSVVIPDSVTSIGDYAFYCCSSLTSVTIPDSVTSIWRTAFYNCSSLTSITIPNSVTRIDYGAFYGCDSLKDVYYLGTQEEWNAISIESNNEPLLNAAIHFVSPLEVTLQPENTAANAGETAVFFVVANGYNLSYQWQYQSAKNTTTWANSSAKTPGYNTPILSVEATEARNGYKYRCVITDGMGEEIITDVAVLTVTGSEPLSIIKQPENKTAAVGTRAEFAVTAGGEGLKYQWQYQSANGTTWKNSSSATVGYNTETLSVEATEARNGYKYRCVITDRFGATVTSDTAVLSVKAAAPAITISAQPQNFSNTAGNTAFFVVRASGEGLTYQWQYKTAKAGAQWQNCSAATVGFDTMVLEVSMEAKRNGYSYRCILTDANGNTVTSATAKLTVK